MKILIANNTFRPYGRGSGAEASSSLMLDGLKKKGYEASVLALRPVFKRQKDKEGKSAVYWPSFYHYLENIPLFLRLFWHLGEFLNVVKFFRAWRLFKKAGVKILIMNNAMGLGRGVYWAAFLSKVKIVQVLHDIQYADPSGQLFVGQESKYHKPAYRAYMMLNGFFLKPVSLVVSPSRWLRDFYRDKSLFAKAPVKVARNPVAGGFFKVPPLKSASDPVKLLYVGQIARHKGIHILLEAVDKMDSATLDLVGKGHNLEKWRRKYSSGKIVFHGYKSLRELPDYYRRSDIVVLPAQCYENCPTLLLEAVASARPFITVNFGGCRELAEDFKGMARRLDSPESMRQAILEAKKNLPGLSRQAESQRTRISDCQRYLERLIKYVV